MTYIIYLLILALFLTAAFASSSLAPWVPARRKDLSRIIDMANIKDKEVFIELGCGDGRVVLEAAKRGARAIGIEVSLPLYFFCLLRKILNPRLDLKFRFADLFKSDLSEADVVYVFGMPDKIKDRLRLKLEKELKPGTRVISYVFRFDAWTPITISKPNPTDIAIYSYTKN